jgi:hypothetical protein
MTKMTDLEWFSGPPPSVGTWIASTDRNSGIRRYWNGHWWSVVIPAGTLGPEALRLSDIRASYTRIEWTHGPKPGQAVESEADRIMRLCRERGL